ncbi:hypothetical protein [Aminobacter sp. LjRoot7]|uniref:hypothetical protein n=1 Tax=Aminobacter sp. LjRoot7 TaxID=3342335 RepID=UPI003ED104DF
MGKQVCEWQAAEFARCFPDAKLKPNCIFIDDGNVWISAGATAGIHLAIAIVEKDLGLEIALKAASELVVFLKRPGGQTQFSTLLAGSGCPKDAYPCYTGFHRGKISAPTSAWP